MTSDHAEAGIAGIFIRLIESSRRLLGHSKTATEAEISHLSLVIDREIIPRLQMTFPSPTPDVEEVASPARPEYDVERFLTVLRSGDVEAAFSFIEDLRDTEHDLIQIYRHLLAPAAQRLGEMWEQDECNFADVTIAVTKMRHMAIATAPLFPIHSFEEGRDAPSILITTVPGEQHTMGLHLAVESFRSEGWNVWSGMPRSTTELIDLVAQQHYDVIGLSISANRNVSVLAEAIVDARRASINDGVKIVIGGGIAAHATDQLEALNVDLIAGELNHALRQVADLVPHRRLRSD
ncbi:MAG: cobalamin B12-binding domain-containing protein [Pseudomonadota bacterium]